MEWSAEESSSVKKEMDGMIAKFESLKSRGRLGSLIITKLQEAAHWYRDLLEEVEAEEIRKDIEKPS